MEREHLPVSDEQIIATGVTWNDYMASYAADFAEWIDGAVIAITPVRFRHNKLSVFLYEEALFYQRDEQGLFQRAPLDENGVYYSRVLPRLALSPTILWLHNLPDGAETSRMDEAMLAGQP